MTILNQTNVMVSKKARTAVALNVDLPKVQPGMQPPLRAHSRARSIPPPID